MMLMKNKYFKFTLMIAAISFWFLIILSSFQPKKTVWLSSLDLTKMVQGWDKPVIDVNKNKKPLSIGKQTFEKGVGTIAKSYVWINLAGGSDKFMAYAGVDNDTAHRSVAGTHRFKVYG